jgi:hypothetical protein
MDLDEFRAAVKQYVALNDQLNASKKHMRDLNRKKESLSEVITKFMADKSLDECELEDGKLILKSSKRIEAVTKDHILKHVASFIEPERATQVVENIYSKRETIERPTLLRTHKRKS